MNPLISDTDFRVINELAQSIGSDSEYLTSKMKNATIMQDNNLPAKIVRLSSLVFLWHSFLRKAIKIRIVLPEEEDLNSRNISVLAPISIAILGLRESDRAFIHIGEIKSELRIIKVINR